ncbi:MAG: sterol desaturase family protein [Rhodospirillales bacterium]
MFENMLQTTDEGAIRLAVFLGALVLFALLETAFPRLHSDYPRARRWPGNLGIVVLDTLLARVLLPGITVGACLWAEVNGIGLFNLVTVPAAAEIAAVIVLFDLAIYAQHVVFHKVPVLWRLHRVHHTDPAFDVTTALRFHPIEILLSLLIKAGLAIALGAPAVAVVTFEMILSAAAMFNHSNLRLPGWLDAGLRLVIVTPDMHRVHHSVMQPETDSNYGFNLSLWDRAFGTYRDQPLLGHDGMTVGQDGFADDRVLGLNALLIQPFQDRDGTLRRDA